MAVFAIDRNELAVESRFVVRRGRTEAGDGGVDKKKYKPGWWRP